MSELKLDLTVFSDGSSDFGIQGDYRLLLSAIGCIDLLKDRAKNFYNQKYGMRPIGESENIDVHGHEVQNEATKKQQVSETKVSRQEAMNAYIELRAKLEKRLQSIANSDPTCTFTIDPNLLKQL